MEFLSTTQRNFKTFAGILGCLQGLTWVVLSIIYLIIYNQDNWDSIVDYVSYMGEVQYFLYIFYVKDVGVQRGDPVLTPDGFIVVVCIYLVLNLAWILASLNILFRQNNKVIISLKLWSLITWLNCLYDFIVTVILGTDHQKCLDIASDLERANKIAIETGCTNGIIPVLMIAAKGFVLWLVNFAFLIVLLSIANKLKQEQNANVFSNFDNSKPYFPETGHPQTPYPQINSPHPHRHSVPANPYHRQNSQLQGSPIYTSPVAQKQKFAPSPPPKPTRSWNVHTGSPRNSPASSYRTDMNNSNRSSPTVSRVPSRQQILSNQTQRPFVLHSPPRRH